MFAIFYGEILVVVSAANAHLVGLNYACKENLCNRISVVEHTSAPVENRIQIARYNFNTIYCIIMGQTCKSTNIAIQPNYNGNDNKQSGKLFVCERDPNIQLWCEHFVKYISRKIPVFRYIFFL